MTRIGRLADVASTARWCAAGVRHAVLLRVMPALRHDLATPISVLRLTANVLQRKLAVQPVDASYCAQRAATLDQQLGALTHALRWLLEWNSGAGQANVTRPELVADCVALLRPLWAIEGVLIEVDPALGQAASSARAAGQTGNGEPAWPRQAALRDLLLASLCYLHDAGAGLTRIRVMPDRHDALALRGFADTVDIGDVAHASAGAIESHESHEVPSRIDATALACLAADLGYLVRFSRDGVWLQLADRKGSEGERTPGAPEDSLDPTADLQRSALRQR